MRLARENLAAVGAGNVSVVTGALTEGWQRDAPYDVVFVNGATESMPRTLCGQLEGGGPARGRGGPGARQPGHAYCSVQGDVSGRPIFDAAAPLLPGFAAPPAFVF